MKKVPRCSIDISAAKNPVYLLKYFVSYPSTFEFRYNLLYETHKNVQFDS